MVLFMPCESIEIEKNSVPLPPQKNPQKETPGVAAALK